MEGDGEIVHFGERQKQTKGEREREREREREMVDRNERLVVG